MTETENSLVYVKYSDHLLFKNSSYLLLNPVLRETIGFLAKQTDDAIWILWDRAITKIPNEKVSSESGLVILRMNIKDIKEIKTIE